MHLSGSGPTTRIATLLNGNTQAITTSEVVLPVGTNLSNFVVSCYANSTAAQTSGSCVLQIYEITMTAIQ
jgi:hypothetical protein